MKAARESMSSRCRWRRSRQCRILSAAASIACRPALDSRVFVEDGVHRASLPEMSEGLAAISGDERVGPYQRAQVTAMFRTRSVAGLLRQTDTGRSQWPVVRAVGLFIMMPSQIRRGEDQSGRRSPELLVSISHLRPERPFHLWLDCAPNSHIRPSGSCPKRRIVGAHISGRIDDELRFGPRSPIIVAGDNHDIVARSFRRFVGSAGIPHGPETAVPRAFQARNSLKQAHAVSISVRREVRTNRRQGVVKIGGSEQGRCEK